MIFEVFDNASKRCNWCLQWGCNNKQLSFVEPKFLYLKAAG